MKQRCCKQEHPHILCFLKFLGRLYYKTVFGKFAQLFSQRHITYHCNARHHLLSCTKLENSALWKWSHEETTFLVVYGTLVWQIMRQESCRVKAELHDHLVFFTLPAPVYTISGSPSVWWSIGHFPQSPLASLHHCMYTTVVPAYTRRNRPTNQST